MPRPRFHPVIPRLVPCFGALLLLLGAGTLNVSAREPQPAKARSPVSEFIDRLLGPSAASRPATPAVPPSAAATTAPVRPDPRVTPGDTLDVTLEDIRTPGYSAKVRDVPQDVKRQAYANYGIRTHAKGEYEVDHLIPLSIGGSNSLKNLWPESYLTDPWNAHVKDALEYRLLSLVRAGKVDLKTAQQEIARDWITAYKKYVGPGPEHPRGQVAASAAGFPASLPPGNVVLVPTTGPGRTTATSSGGVTPAAPPDQKPDMSGTAVPAVAPVRGPASPAVPAVVPAAAAATVKTPPPPGPAPAPVVNARGKTQVWLNTRTGAFHRPGSRYYGKTKEGKYLTEAAALAAGFHAAPDGD